MSENLWNECLLWFGITYIVQSENKKKNNN